MYLQRVLDYHQEVLNVRSDSVIHSPLQEFKKHHSMSKSFKIVKIRFQVLEPPFWIILDHFGILLLYHQQLHWLPGSAKYTAEWQLGRAMHWLQGFALNLSWLSGWTLREYLEEVCSWRQYIPYRCISHEHAMRKDYIIFVTTPYCNITHSKTCVVAYCCMHAWYGLIWCSDGYDGYCDGYCSVYIYIY